MLASELLAHKRRSTKKRPLRLHKSSGDRGGNSDCGGRDRLAVLPAGPPPGIRNGGRPGVPAADRSRSRQQVHPVESQLSWTFSCGTTPYRAGRLASSSTGRPYTKVKRLLMEMLVAYMAASKDKPALSRASISREAVTTQPDESDVTHHCRR